jgi:hypothetical protein
MITTQIAPRGQLTTFTSPRCDAQWGNRRVARRLPEKKAAVVAASAAAPSRCCRFSYNPKSSEFVTIDDCIEAARA